MVAPCSAVAAREPGDAVKCWCDVGGYTQLATAGAPRDDRVTGRSTTGTTVAISAARGNPSDRPTWPFVLEVISLLVVKSKGWSIASGIGVKGLAAGRYEKWRRFRWLWLWAETRHADPSHRRAPRAGTAATL